ncbi:MAG: hypothetical protein AAB270_05110 [Chloroflexota bacterium]
MSVEEFLLPGEEVKAQLGDLYATPTRILKYRRSFLGLFGEAVRESPYRHVAYVSLRNRCNKLLVYIGAILAGVGALGWVVKAGMDALGQLLPWNPPTLPSPLPLVLVGHVLVLAGLAWRQSVVEVRIDGVAAKERGGSFSCVTAKHKQAKAFVVVLLGYLPV